MACILFVALQSLAGCMVRVDQGGYAAPCMIAVDGWTLPGTGSMRKEIGPVKLDLDARVIDFTAEPGAFIEVSARAFAARERHAVLLDPKTVRLLIAGKEHGARDAVRENPQMKHHWQCGGQMDVPADLSRCGPGMLSFDTTIPSGSGFVLRIGSLVLDGEPLAVPGIKFCPIPRTTRRVPFHG